jgi:hypothetical protein
LPAHPAWIGRLPVREKRITIVAARHDCLLSNGRESARGTRQIETSVLADLPPTAPPIDLQQAFKDQLNRIDPRPASGGGTVTAPSLAAD